MTGKTKKDNLELLSLQDAFLTNPNDKNWTALWYKCQEVTLKIVERECLKKHLTFNLTYKKVLADDAVLRLFERYKKNKDKGIVYRFYNFVAGLYHLVMWSMYSDWRQRQKEDMSYDLVCDGDKFDSVNKLNKRRLKK